ncbi:MAG: hypothetical protein HZA16_01140 [Nitrospirae bacterium]|nr:hypothetical protein [Nitrospirota bacterium]
MNCPYTISKKYEWQSLLKKDGDDLFDHYRYLPDELRKEKGLLGLIFGRARNKFQDPEYKPQSQNNIGTDDCPCAYFGASVFPAQVSEAVSGRLSAVGSKNRPPALTAEC